MSEVNARPSYAGALLRYRVMAYVTGVALLTATILLILAAVDGEDKYKTANTIVWTAHGYLFLIYAVAALHLGVKLRWSIIRIVLVVIAGTIPLMSFVAERYTARYVRAHESASRAR